MVRENQPVTRSSVEHPPDYTPGANVCCFCGKSIKNDGSERRELTIKTTDGNVLVVQYDEHCFREWLGDDGPLVPISLAV